MKLLPVLSGLLMVAITTLPMTAEACSRNKSGSDAGTTSQPVPQEDTTQT